jgi:hypothetical protein
VCIGQGGFFIREWSISFWRRPTVGGVRCSVSAWVGGRGSAASHVERLQKRSSWCYSQCFCVRNIGQIEGDRTRDVHGRLTAVQNERIRSWKEGGGRGSHTACRRRRLLCLSSSGDRSSDCNCRFLSQRSFSFELSSWIPTGGVSVTIGAHLTLGTCQSYCFYSDELLVFDILCERIMASFVPTRVVSAITSAYRRHEGCITRLWIPRFDMRCPSS